MTSFATEIPQDVDRRRVRAVEQLNLLDTPREDRFDHITRIARRVFNVPMSTVSLIDRDRQWFKSAQGLDLVEVPRDMTICQTTIARSYTRPTDPALIVTDASEVAQFASLPGVGGEDGIRFYAGFPLYGPGGHPVGVFCIYDTRPRTLDAQELDAFKDVAAWAQRELERSEDLVRAAEVQRELLPAGNLAVDGYDIAGACVPAYAVGGDFYDHYRTRRGVIVSVCDLMGKGMGAAILAASVRSALRGVSRALDAATAETDLAWVMGAAAAQLADDFDRTARFATVFHALLDPATGVVEYVDAGHGLAAVRKADGTVQRLAAGGLPLGVAVDGGWQSQRVTLEPGDMLVVCSDGILDLIDESGTNASAVLPLLASQAGGPGQLVASARGLARSAAPIDDVTIIAVRRAADSGGEP
ncbi:SpoIIE family protein phosphatase [Hoyosella sp. G463]|uniref:SpoIIE family protein phosphatase n=1 Tax=Lolliginicoccus lacisalsi TaxID=2742202 RepID=A0A927PML0_9ACTN|nr:GAF domain-containing SpoIIE family protein phosphatase [Lolliginicoccus lacisalsi]MBD8506707.1 SpoIIE family protein phosphatase [Lolliginicoccus lacisalsi]